MPRLRSIGPGIWMADGPVVDFFGFPYSTRMVVARLKGGALWVWSPIERDEQLSQEIDALGQPAHLVSPNKLHHLYLADWKNTYPHAKIWGLPSVQAKRRDIDFGGTLAATPPTDWVEDIDQVVFAGSPFMDECVFFHRASKTAIFADLSENFSHRFLHTAEGWTWWKRLVARIWHITEPFGMAPLEWRLSFLDRDKARNALAKIEGWGAEQVVMAHGQWVPEGGSTFIARSFRWLKRPTQGDANDQALIDT